MAYTTPPTKSANQSFTSTEFNTYIRDNLGYLFSGRPLGYIIREGSSDYTTTSATFAAVDTTNLRHTLTINSGRVLLYAAGSISHSSSTATFSIDFLRDGTTRVGSTAGLYKQKAGSTGIPIPFSVVGYFSGLAVGSYTFDLAWATSAATATMQNNAFPIIFFAMEV